MIMLSYQRKERLKIPLLETLLLQIKDFCTLNLYKCSQPSLEFMFQFLLLLVNEHSSVKVIYNTNNYNQIWSQKELVKPLEVVGSYVQSVEVKGLVVQIITCLMSTAAENKNVVVNVEDNSRICELLIGACMSQDLMLIAHALNGFYDIYSENYYNQVLQEFKVMELMQAGLPQLIALVISMS